MQALSLPRLSPLLILPFVVFTGCDSTNSIQEARALQESGAYGASLEPLRDHLQDMPQDAEARFLYGVALSALSRPSEAQWSLREAMRDKTWLSPAGLVLARDALTTGNYHSALQVANQILELDSSSLDGLQLRATAALMSRKAYDEALEDADRIIQLAPDHPDAGVLRAIALLGLYRVEEAEEQLLAAETNRGETAPGVQALYCVTMISFFETNQDLEHAEQQVDRCRTKYPNNAQVVSAAVEFFDSQGKSETSLAILEETLADKPGELGVRSGLAQRLIRLGRRDEADALMVEATGFVGGIASVPARLELHSFYKMTGRGLEAAEALAEVADLLGEQAGSQMQLALVEDWIGLGEFEKAEALAANITDPAHRAFAEANIAVFRGENHYALERYSEGYKTWPNNAAARYYGAYAAEQLGLFDRAIDEYRYSIRSDPSATDARQRLARLFMAEGELVLAYETILVDVSNNPLPPKGISLAAELSARLGKAPNVARQIALLKDRPGLRAEAVAAAARGVAGGSGPANGARFIEEAKLDLTDPRESEALRTLVTLHAQAGNTTRANQLVHAALASAPRAPTFHEIQGLLLERYSPGHDLALAAYQRALSLNPSLPRALAGTARIKFQAGALDEGVTLFARAHEVDPADSGIGRAYAAALIRVDRKAEAQSILEHVLEEDPVDGRAALSLARLLGEQSPGSDQALALAERATRFEAGDASFDFLADCLEARDDTEGASEARKRAEASRQSAEKRRSPNAL
jgi:predicted Zn-dependent protease